MTTYQVKKSDGSTLTTIYPFETSGPGGQSTPFQVGCGYSASILSIVPGNMILAGNVSALFTPGYKFSISGGTANDGNYTVGTSTYNVGMNQTFIAPSPAVVSASPAGTANLQIFLLSGDQVNSPAPNRFVSGFNFLVQRPPIPPNTGPNVGSYSVLSGSNAVYDPVSTFTAIPVVGPIPSFDTNPFLPGQYQLVYSIGASSVLTMVGQDSLNWGNDIWENMVRMTEHFAASTSPDVNPNIGTNTPIKGQLWFNTGTASYKFYNGSTWVDLGSGIGPIAGVVTSVTASGFGITASPTTGSVVISNTGVTQLTAGTGISLSPAGGTGVVQVSSTTGGTVTSVAAIGSTGLAVTGSPITTSGTLTLTLDTDLQALAGLSTTGFVQRTGIATYTAANLLSSQVTTALGFTPYNSTNPAGYISTNQTITLTGAVTGSGTTSIATTLANSGVVAGTYGSATSSSVVNVNAKGLVIGATSTPIHVFAGSTPGLVPTSPGGTTDVLIANGTWGPTPGGIASTTIATNGRIVFSSGLIMQWGAVTTGVLSGENVAPFGPYSFGFAFPTACLSCQLTGNGGAPLGVTNLTTTTFSIYTGFTGGHATTVVYYYAIGH